MHNISHTIHQLIHICMAQMKCLCVKLLFLLILVARRSAFDFSFRFDSTSFNWTLNMKSNDDGSTTRPFANCIPTHTHTHTYYYDCYVYVCNKCIFFLSLSPSLLLSSHILRESKEQEAKKETERKQQYDNDGKTVCFISHKSTTLNMSDAREWHSSKSFFLLRNRIHVLLVIRRLSVSIFLFRSLTFGGNKIMRSQKYLT